MTPELLAAKWACRVAGGLAMYVGYRWGGSSKGFIYAAGVYLMAMGNWIQ